MTTNTPTISRDSPKPRRYLQWLLCTKQSLQPSLCTQTSRQISVAQHTSVIKSHVCFILVHAILCIQVALTSTHSAIIHVALDQCQQICHICHRPHSTPKPQVIVVVTNYQFHPSSGPLQASPGTNSSAQGLIAAILSKAQGRMMVLRLQDRILYPEITECMSYCK